MNDADPGGRTQEETDPETQSCPTERRELEPMDAQLTSIQPGGGIVIHLEQAWGAIRRAYLRTFRRSYVERMRQSRLGDDNKCPHDVLDPRDVKFFANQGGYRWLPGDDPFAWRDGIPFARAGLAELFIMSGIAILSSVALTYICLQYELTGVAAIAGWLGSLTALVIGILIVWFFRDPERTVPLAADCIVAPADGKVVSIETCDDDFVGEGAICVGIFLSIFNVHLNRMPQHCRVIGLTYRKGKFLNAMRPESARENEQLAIRMESLDDQRRPFVVRQITGAIARRIVCWLRPGDTLPKGARLGMIKLGSRTELVVPADTRLSVNVGDRVRAGQSIIGWTSLPTQSKP